MSNAVDHNSISRAASMALTPGQPAPEFVLYRTPDQTVSLHGLRGHWAVLAFLGATWNPISMEQLVQFQALLHEFSERDAALVAIGNDNIWCQMAFARQHHLGFPLLADSPPLGAVAQRYGVYLPESGTSRRALFVIDGDGVICWSHSAPHGINPGVDGVLTVLDVLALHH